MARVVDAHCHKVLPCYLEVLRRAGVDPAQLDGFPQPPWDLDRHLAFMGGTAEALFGI